MGKSKLLKRTLSVCLMAAMAVTLIAGCGKGDDGGGNEDKRGETPKKDATFTWWINQTDGSGEYYEDYKESSVAQFVNQQYWDTENGGIGTEESGTKIELSFLVPIAGSESDNFNTMISTGEYPEIIDMARAADSPQTMYEEGILLDITEYVESYMPNYTAYLDKYPELKPLVQVLDEEGEPHYIAIYSFSDGVQDPWEGTCYRRDWVVKYAEPTEYVWDWESDYVKENGHPEVTPLSEAVKAKNMEGWKKNEVTAFQAEYGENPNETYSDNVIFPSGTADPITISDWEWMLEAFAKAIEERGWAQDSSSYGFAPFFYGYSSMGDLTSSFGGGTGSFYVKDGTVSFDGSSENFKTYLECMNNWYEKGWLDSQFHTRASDMFYMINSAGVNQGKVGMWCGMTSTLGTAIRTSCQNEVDARDAFVMGCALPINDMYGEERQQFKEPDALYQGSRRGTAIGITNKAEEKDLAALFTFMDWTYTLEGAKVMRVGLNAEQYASMTLEPDIFADYDIETAYTEETDEEGNLVITPTFEDSNTLFLALLGQRMDVGLKLTRSGELAVVNKKAEAVMTNAYGQWTKFLNTGNVLDYTSLLNPEESEQYSKIGSACTDYQSQTVPNVIQGTMSWEDYVAGLEKIDTDTAVDILQKYVDLAKGAKSK